MKVVYLRLINLLLFLTCVVSNIVTATIWITTATSNIANIFFGGHVITGVIKSNIPSRIAFAVSSGIDSRTILDSVGAERLLGNGDMLYMPIGQNSPERVQGVFVTDNEVFDITEDVKKRGGSPIYDDHFIMLDGVDNNVGLIGVSDDPMFEEIKEYVIQAQKASTSLLQRRFGIGYNRAARMIDALEDNGIIGPAQGSKPREVFVKPE